MTFTFCIIRVVHAIFRWSPTQDLHSDASWHSNMDGENLTNEDAWQPLRERESGFSRDMLSNLVAIRKDSHT